MKGMTYKGNIISEEEVLELLKKNIWNIQDIKNPSYELKLFCVKCNAYTLEYFSSPNEELCLEAVKQNANVITIINNPTQTMIDEAIAQKPFLKTTLENLKNNNKKHEENINISHDKKDSSLLSLIFSFFKIKNKTND